MKTTLNALLAHHMHGQKPDDFAQLYGYLKLVSNLPQITSLHGEVSIRLILTSNGLKDALWALRTVPVTDASSILMRQFALYCLTQATDLLFLPPNFMEWLAHFENRTKRLEEISTNAHKYFRLEQLKSRPDMNLLHVWGALESATNPDYPYAAASFTSQHILRLQPTLLFSQSQELERLLLNYTLYN